MALPAVVATLATIIVLVPLALMPGMGKFLFRPLALAVAFAMLASLFLALTFVPSRCAAWLRSHGSTRRRPLRDRLASAPAPSSGIEFLLALDPRYERLLRVALRHRAVVLGGVGLLFVGSLALLPCIGQEFFPQVDTGQLTIFFRCPTGTKIEKTNERLAGSSSSCRT